MPETLTDETTPPTQDVETSESHDEPLVAETLVEEVSIDGMCGVY